MNFKSKTQKILRFTSAGLLIVLVGMVTYAFLGLDIKENPLFSLYYFGAVVLLVLAVCITSIWELFEIRKELKKSLVEDQKFLVSLLNQALESEGDREREEQVN